MTSGLSRMRKKTRTWVLTRWSNHQSSVLARAWGADGHESWEQVCGPHGLDGPGCHSLDGACNCQNFRYSSCEELDMVAAAEEEEDSETRWATWKERVGHTWPGLDTDMTPTPSKPRFNGQAVWPRCVWQQIEKLRLDGRSRRGLRHRGDLWLRESWGQVWAALTWTDLDGTCLAVARPCTTLPAKRLDMVAVAEEEKDSETWGATPKERRGPCGLEFLGLKI
jgi:hypothetical protein